VGEKNLDQGLLEYQGRRDADSQQVARSEIVGLLQAKLARG